MKLISAILYIGIIVSLIACNGTDASNPNGLSTDASGLKTKDNSALSTISQDSITLTTLVRNVYEWQQKSLKGVNDFDIKKVDPADTVYKSIDWTKHNNILNKLKRSGFFATEFCENYQNIALQIDTALKSGTAVWPEGELPTIGGYEADPWFSAQDFPDDNYWERMTLANIQVEKNSASFKWNIAGDYNYLMKAKKENGTWKISYMQGLDLVNYSSSK